MDAHKLFNFSKKGYGFQWSPHIKTMIAIAKEHVGSDAVIAETRRQFGKKVAKISDSGIRAAYSRYHIPITPKSRRRKTT